MHFSRPSAYRLSWCRPWYLGLVGVFSNGYCSVTVGLNIDEMVTPKPATGASAWPMPFFAGLSGWYPGSGSAGAPTSRVGRRVMSFSATWLLLPAGVGWGQWAGRGLDGRDTLLGLLGAQARRPRRRRQRLARQRGHGVAAGEGIEPLPPTGLGGCLRPLGYQEGQQGAAEGERCQHEQHGPQLDVGEPADALHARDGHHPDQPDRDEHLPAEPHELVVAEADKRAADPDEEEHEQPELAEEPQHRPPAGVEHPVVDRGQRPRCPPAPEEQGRRDRRDVDHVDVLRQEEPGELHRRVLG